MAPRAYWKGSLKLSLVTCPVALYPATTAVEKTRFHLKGPPNGGSNPAAFPTLIASWSVALPF